MLSKDVLYQSWITWSLAEGSSKAFVKVFQKLAGGLSSFFTHILLITATVSLVQVAVGAFGSRSLRVSLFCERRLLIGSLLFGIVAFCMTVLAYAVFLPSLNGDVGISTLIITLAIFPSAVIDQFVFKDRVSPRALAGFTLGAFAGYTVLGWPSLAQLASLPVWVWMSAVIMLLAVVNEFISRWIRSIHPLAKNFWGGLANFACCLAALLWLDSLQLFFTFTPQIRYLYAIALVTGLVTTAMWIFKVVSYRVGASIALKSLVMNGTFLSAAMLAGILFFGEPAAAHKLLGIILYLTAFSIAHDPLWRFFKSFRYLTTAA